MMPIMGLDLATQLQLYRVLPSQFFAMVMVEGGGGGGGCVVDGKSTVDGELMMVHDVGNGGRLSEMAGESLPCLR